LIGKNYKEISNITAASAKSILKKRLDEEEGEKQHVQTTTSEYMNKYCKTPKSKAEEKLKKLIATGLDEVSAVRVVDFMPEDREDVKLVLGKKRMTDDEVKKVLKIVEA
jgi:DNA-directed RNA polymerase subunit F